MNERMNGKNAILVVVCSLVGTIVVASRCLLPSVDNDDSSGLLYDMIW
jgi:hypothetical protein